MNRKKHKVPGLNTTSTADISFMLLIFFLVTTSMDTDKGLAFRLPPPEPKQQTETLLDVKERNMLTVKLTDNDSVTCQGKPITLKALKDKTKEFVANPQNRADLPECSYKDVQLLGKTRVSDKHVINLECSASTSYDAYFGVLNVLVKAYNELRDVLAVKRFVHTFKECTREEQDAIREVYPQKISESNSEDIAQQGEEAVHE